MFCRTIFKNGSADKKSSLRKALEYGAERDEPLVCSASLGATWAYVFEKRDGAVAAVHVLGPVCFSDLNVKEVERECDK